MLILITTAARLLKVIVDPYGAGNAPVVTVHGVMVLIMAPVLLISMVVIMRLML